MVAETTLNAADERVRVFDEVPELLQQLDNGDASTLRRLTTQMLRLQPGVWQLELQDSELRGHLGLLVLDGLLTRQVVIGEATCAELLGGGDVLRPWTELDSGIASIASESRWQVVMPTRIAILNARFALQTCRWPGVTAAIIDRVVQRARWLSFHLAVCHIVGVEVRLMIVLWHFADRWGRMTGAGVKLPLPLSHGLLAGIVGARRPDRQHRARSAARPGPGGAHRGRLADARRAAGGAARAPCPCGRPRADDRQVRPAVRAALSGQRPAPDFRRDLLVADLVADLHETVDVLEVLLARLSGETLPDVGRGVPAADQLQDLASDGASRA